METLVSTVSAQRAHLNHQEALPPLQPLEHQDLQNLVLQPQPLQPPKEVITHLQAAPKPREPHPLKLLTPTPTLPLDPLPAAPPKQRRPPPPVEILVPPNPPRQPKKNKLLTPSSWNPP